MHESWIVRCLFSTHCPLLGAGVALTPMYKICASLNTKPMRKFYLTKLLLSTTVLVASGIFSFAQCPVGSSTATVNWDNLDYLTQSGNYAAFVSTAMMQTQKFTMGVNRLSINFPATMTTAGETTINTAETGSYGS